MLVILPLASQGSLMCSQVCLVELVKSIGGEVHGNGNTARLCLLIA